MSEHRKIDCEEMKSRYDAARAEKKRKKVRDKIKQDKEYANYAMQENTKYLKRRYYGKGGCVQ